MRVPKLFDLRADPFERGEEGFKYDDWYLENAPLGYEAPPVLMKWLESFKEFPPRAKAASFTIDQVVAKLMPKDRSLSVVVAAALSPSPTQVAWHIVVLVKRDLR